MEFLGWLYVLFWIVTKPKTIRLRKSSNSLVLFEAGRNSPFPLSNLATYKLRKRLCWVGVSSCKLTMICSNSDFIFSAHNVTWAFMSSNCSGLYTCLYLFNVNSVCRIWQNKVSCMQVKCLRSIEGILNDWFVFLLGFPQTALERYF